MKDYNFILQIQLISLNKFLNTSNKHLMKILHIFYLVSSNKIGIVFT